MADPISIASGALALAIFAFQSSVSLYQTITSFQNKKKDIRELKEELEALGDVIQSLQQIASTDEVQFEALRLPLLRCGKACKDFEEIIVNCTKRSSESRTSFRDWAKLKYMGDDIAGFKNMLTGYKSTISIAIGDVNLRTAITSATIIQEFKKVLANTTDDLKERLEDLDGKFEALRIQEISSSDERVAEQGRISEEIDSVKECLAVCDHAKKHIDEVKTHVFEDVSAAENAHQAILSTFSHLISAKRVTAGAGATQWLGGMSDATVQKLSRDRNINLSNLLGMAKGVEQKNRGEMKYEDYYGTGKRSN